ncbi:arylamine N-acetyltransferase family protein [Ilumatobacter sp.]|uniref:arylamine N-acetyltransferase family protein n=1 Tax=Ilumatobacter sp. TaxID=1967498 RepID=UPI003B527B4C
MAGHPVDSHLARIGLERTDIETGGEGLARLQRAHMAAVPFENLDIALGDGVPHDVDLALERILGGRRGGWCFALNSTFALLLEALGFDVVLLGAAVLLDGPSTTIDHLALEVAGGEGDLVPHLVDVGFGDSFDIPLALNDRSPQDGGPARFQLIDGTHGTTLTEIVDDVPAARYRFKRVAHRFSQFAPVAERLQTDPDLHWSMKPFATRLLDPSSSDRVTLTRDRLELRRGSTEIVEDVAARDWDDALAEWFGITPPPGGWRRAPGVADARG